MLVLVLDEASVPRPVRLEGAALYLHRRVRISARSADAVRACVRAARTFDVRVEAADEGRTRVACDCVPFTESNAACRHVWAALIKLQNENLLPVSGADGPAATPGLRVAGAPARRSRS